MTNFINPSKSIMSRDAGRSRHSQPRNQIQVRGLAWNQLRVGRQSPVRMIRTCQIPICRQYPTGTESQVAATSQWRGRVEKACLAPLLPHTCRIFQAILLWLRSHWVGAEDWQQMRPFSGRDLSALIIPN